VWIIVCFYYRLRRTHRSDPARINISFGAFSATVGTRFGPAVTQARRRPNYLSGMRAEPLIAPLASCLRCAAEQLARLLAQWQSSFRLGPALTTPNVQADGPLGRASNLTACENEITRRWGRSALLLLFRWTCAGDGLAHAAALALTTASSCGFGACVGRGGDPSHGISGSRCIRGAPLAGAAGGVRLYCLSAMRTNSRNWDPIKLSNSIGGAASIPRKGCNSANPIGAIDQLAIQSNSISKFTERNSLVAGLAEEAEIETGIASHYIRVPLAHRSIVAALVLRWCCPL